MREEPLAGGNVAASVVRVGDTVRRPAGPWTPAVQALLGYLAEVGFRGAPRPYGLDEQGREVLEFVPGDVAWPDHFDALADPAAVARVGRLIREYHDAVAGFRPPADARWRQLWPPHGDEIIAHHDLAPWNLVLGARPVFIDWDGAGPGTRLWDLAYAVHGFVPLAPHVGADGAGVRLRTVVDGYGLDEDGRRELVALLPVPAQAMYDLLERGADTGEQPWARLWSEGHGAVWRADTDFIERHRARWLTALLD